MILDSGRTVGNSYFGITSVLPVIRSEPRGWLYTARLFRCDLPEHSPLATILLYYPRGRDEEYPTSTMFQRRGRVFDRGELSDTSPVGLVSAARIGPRDPHFRVRAIVAAEL